MSGSTRLKIVLSGVYWVAVGLVIWAVESGGGQEGAEASRIMFGTALALYVTLAVGWWAFAGLGIGRRR
jgi:hypothetical protein